MRMDSPNDEVLGDFMMENESTMMDTERSDAIEEDDPFLKFIDSANQFCTRSRVIQRRMTPRGARAGAGLRIGFSEPASRIRAAWNEQNRSGALKKQSDFIAKLKKKHKRAKLLNTITIDSIYEKRFLPLSSVIEAVIVNVFVLPGTDICMLTLGDIWSSNTIDLYLHRRFYNIADPSNGPLKKGREVLLAGCYLRVSAGSSGCPRLLPTEYFVVLLDEDEDYDAMFLAAKFCTDSFSTISLDEVKGVSHSFYARIEYIGPVEVHVKYGNLQRKQITLVDNDGVRLNFSLWGEQVLIANLFSIGSMLALDKPFIGSSLEASHELCLEYGSATQLYLVPTLPHKEHVSVALTQNHFQGSRLLNASNLSEGPLVSQVTLPCDSQGSIDFSNYPFRSYIVDLRDKMMGISIYGIVTDIRASKGIFSLRIEDATGAIWAHLHFEKSWSLGRLGKGHTVFISGLSSSLNPRKSLEVSWYENRAGSSFFNLSCLLAFLNTPTLHRLSCISDLSIHTRGAQVCQVWVAQVEHCHVDLRFMHSIFGHLVEKPSPNVEAECKFCGRVCEGEVECTFLLEITIADETGKVFASCIGQTAAELLQISPDEFAFLHEEEQIIYPTMLGQEKFVVAIANHRRKGSCEGFMEQDQSTADWEVTLAIKC
ncbi:hypothetical protein SASPL_112545 [Salvia splendens]|uniref:Uncharacterized protein n=1 Tax=Salvia splendens TaxID=180675 RepID=A0A8X9A667_SALSN|nr:hypothetical protein SASPL_112545 [Salvia splendens]